MIFPGKGRNVSGHSALMRHSSACPRGVMSLRKAEPFARGDANLLFHQINARDHFGDRMLYLIRVFISMK